MADELGGVHHLATAQGYAQSSTSALRSRLHQLQRFSDEYSSLSSRLQSLSRATRHELMVPLGPLAFQPGYLTHTNEVTVLLGERIMVERSTSQSVDIIARRLDYLRKQQDAVQQQIDNTHAKAKHSRDMFGGVSGAGGGSDDASAVSAVNELGVRFADGKFLNEAGEEIVEIKEQEEEAEEEKEVQTKAQTTRTVQQGKKAEVAGDVAVPSSASATSPAAAAASATPSTDGARSFPSILDKNFDQFWDELAELEQQEEQQAKATAAQPAGAPAAAAAPLATAANAAQSSATGSPASVEPDLLEPVPSPPLRPIHNPADIFLHMQQARIRAGAEPPPQPLPPVARPSTAAATASNKAASSPSNKGAGSVGSSAASSSVSAAVSTSRSLDAAFADYKTARASSRAARKAARVQERGARKGVRFAPGVRGGAGAPALEEDDSSSDSEEEEHEVVRQPAYGGRNADANRRAEQLALRAEQQLQQQRAQQQTSSRPASASSAPSRSAPSASRAATSATGSVSASAGSRADPLPYGEVRERGAPAAAVAAPNVAAAQAQQAAASAARTSLPLHALPPTRIMAAAASSASASSSSAAPPPKMSKFKAKMLGLDFDD